MHKRGELDLTRGTKSVSSLVECREIHRLLPKRRDGDQRSQLIICQTDDSAAAAIADVTSSTPAKVTCLVSQRLRHLEGGFPLLVQNDTYLVVGRSVCVFFFGKVREIKKYKKKKITFIFQVTLPVLYNVPLEMNQRDKHPSMEKTQILKCICCC